MPSITPADWKPRLTFTTRMLFPFICGDDRYSNRLALHHHHAPLVRARLTGCSLRRQTSRRRPPGRRRAAQERQLELKSARGLTMGTSGKVCVSASCSECRPGESGPSWHERKSCIAHAITPSDGDDERKGRRFVCVNQILRFLICSTTTDISVHVQSDGSQLLCTRAAAARHGREARSAAVATVGLASLSQCAVAARSGDVEGTAARRRARPQDV